MDEKPLLPKQIEAAERNRRARAELVERTAREIAEVRRILAEDCPMCKATLALADELCKSHQHVKRPDDLYDDRNYRPRRLRAADRVSRARRQLGG